MKCSLTKCHLIFLFSNIFHCGFNFLSFDFFKISMYLVQRTFLTLRTWTIQFCTFQKILMEVSTLSILLNMYFRFKYHIPVGLLCYQIIITHRSYFKRILLPCCLNCDNKHFWSVNRPRFQFFFNQNDHYRPHFVYDHKLEICVILNCNFWTAYRYMVSINLFFSSTVVWVKFKIFHAFFTLHL